VIYCTGTSATGGRGVLDAAAILADLNLEWRSEMNRKEWRLSKEEWLSLNHSRRRGSLGLSDLSKQIVRLPYTAALVLKEIRP
jgi:hypothetical protein